LEERVENNVVRVGEVCERALVRVLCNMLAYSGYIRTIIMMDTYFRAVHSRSISGKMSSYTLESSQAEQSGSPKRHLRLLHCGDEMSECVQWSNEWKVK
jgi:hypothetical protein